MAEKLTEESASLPGEVILLLIIFLILIFILGGGSIEGIFNLFKTIIMAIVLYLMAGLRGVLEG